MLRDRLVRRLLALGWTKLGAGDYAEVFGHICKDYVIKVGKIKDPSDEDAWPIYANLVREWFSNNPYAPKISSLRFYGRFYVARVERCELVMDNVKCAETHDKMNDLRNFYWNPHLNERAADNYPEACALLMAVKNLGKTADLHSGNVMVKGDRMIFTDPIC